MGSTIPRKNCRTAGREPKKKVIPPFWEKKKKKKGVLSVWIERESCIRPNHDLLPSVEIGRRVGFTSSASQGITRSLSSPKRIKQGITRKQYQTDVRLMFGFAPTKAFWS